MKQPIEVYVFRLQGFGQVVSSTLAEANREFLATNGGSPAATDTLSSTKTSPGSGASSGSLLAGLLPTWLGGTPTPPPQEQMDPRTTVHEVTRLLAIIENTTE